MAMAMVVEESVLGDKHTTTRETDQQASEAVARHLVDGWLVVAAMCGGGWSWHHRRC